MRSLKESIIGNNSAGMVSIVKDMLQTNPGLRKKRIDHLNKLNDLWKKLGLSEGDYFWSFIYDTYILKQNSNTNKSKAYIYADPGSYLCLASNADKENQMNEELRDKIIKVLGLKLAAKYTYWNCYKL